MATIVTQNQNPSWGSAALMLLAPLLTDALKRHHEANANRKLNAARGEFVNALQQPNNSYNPIDEIPDLTPTPNYNDGWGRAVNQAGNAADSAWANAILGNDSNVWRNVFKEDGSSQSPFNTMNLSQQQAPAQNNSIPTQADIARASAQILANPRFSMIDPAQFGETIKPYADAMNLARQEQELKELVSDFTNAGDLNAKRNILASGLMNNQITPENFLNLAKAYTPVQRQINTGTVLIDQMLDAWTGKPTSSQIYKLSMTPEQQANADYRNASLAQQGRQFDETNAFNYWNARENNQLARDRLAEDIRRNNRDFDWTEQVYKNSQNAALGELTQREQKMLEINNAQITQLQTAYSTAAQEWANADDKDKPFYKAQMDRAEAAIKQLDLENKMILYRSSTQVMPPQSGVPDENNTNQNGGTLKTNTPTTTGDENNIWDYFTDGKKFGVSSEYSKFRIIDGKGRAHNGIDILATAGSRLTVPNIKGMRNFQVKKVACDKGGYGNYVDLEADYFGHKVNFRFAHLMDSPRLKELEAKQRAGQKLNAGELIAQTGNTGRVRGDNDGYHLHIETSLDGNRIDPKTFFNETANYQKGFELDNKRKFDEFKKLNIRAQPSNEAISFFATADPLSLATMTGYPPSENYNDTVVLYDSDGNKITYPIFEKHFKNMLEKGYTFEDYLNWLNSQGYKRN